MAGSATPAGEATTRWATGSGGPGPHVVAGRSVGAGAGAGAGAAVAANAFAANALDLDDGYRPLKGHPGAVVVPAALTAAEVTGAAGEELLAAVLVGYEVALRAGTLLRAEYATYHGTGAWAPVGAAAAVARLRGLDAATTATALAVAEFHAPITPVMRTVDHPAMLEDGTGWGALAGYAAVDLALARVTGPPTLFEHRRAEAAALPVLGGAYPVEDVYVKLAATCRWAQPAVAAVLAAGRGDPGRCRAGSGRRGNGAGRHLLGGDAPGPHPADHDGAGPVQHPVGRRLRPARRPGRPRAGRDVPTRRPGDPGARVVRPGRGRLRAGHRVPRPRPGAGGGHHHRRPPGALRPSGARAHTLG